MDHVLEEDFPIREPDQKGLRIEALLFIIDSGVIEGRDFVQFPVSSHAVRFPCLRSILSHVYLRRYLTVLEVMRETEPVRPATLP